MFEVGEQVGAYTIVRRLGAGGMGEVYLGRHRHIGRDAAIKVLLPELSSNEDVVARFFTEARATAAIRHPGIVEILDCDIHKTGRAYIVMEFLDGENLAECLVRVRSFAGDLTSAGVIMAQAASAVGAAHAKGIVHRDLKPDNVFLVGPPVSMPVAGTPLVKILDFGVAKLVTDDGQGRNKTRTGSLLGTPTYMSPEQCRGAGNIDHRTDVYALGCMAFEVISGRPPFVREGSGEVLVAHLVEKPPTLSSVVPSVSPELDALVAQMLEKDPAARPQSMAEIVGRLESMFGIVGSTMMPGEGLSGAMRLPGAGIGSRTPAYGAATGHGTAAGGSPFLNQKTTPFPDSPSITAAAAAARAGTAAGTGSSPGTSGSGSSPGSGTSPVAAAVPPVASGPSPVIAGGTRVMAAVPALPSPPPSSSGTTPGKRTTLSDSASEKTGRTLPGGGGTRKKWTLPALVGGGVVAVGVVIAIAMSGGGDKPRGDGNKKPVVADPTPPKPVDPPKPVTPPPPAEVTIEIASDPPGAQVWLPGDDVSHGTTPLKIAVRKGEPPVRVTLKAEGYQDATVALDPAREEGGPLNVAMVKTKGGGKHDEAVANKSDKTDKLDKTDKTSGKTDGKGKGKGKWSGPKDENDIYKAMGD